VASGDVFCARGRFFADFRRLCPTVPGTGMNVVHHGGGGHHPHHAVAPTACHCTADFGQKSARCPEERHLAGLGGSRVSIATDREKAGPWPLSIGPNRASLRGFATLRPGPRESRRATPC
jgi:hypothetical protein